MRFGLSVILPLAVAAVAACPPALHAADSRVQMMRMRSESLNDPGHSVRVYLPPSYHDPTASDRRYPVVFLLHGWPGGDGNWSGQGRCADLLDSMSAQGEIPEMIAVMPNGNGVGTLGRSLWLNSADGKSRMEDFVANDLVAWTDSMFRTRADAADRVVIGLSDGGTGAFNLLIRHPERFGGAGSLSGRFRLEKGMGINPALAGSGDAARAFLNSNSPASQVESHADQLRKQHLYFSCGAGDENLDDNREFHALLTRLHIPHRYEEFKGGHGWGYWRNHLRESLKGLAGSMSR